MAVFRKKKSTYGLFQTFIFIRKIIINYSSKSYQTLLPEIIYLRGIFELKMYDINENVLLLFYLINQVLQEFRTAVD